MHVEGSCVLNTMTCDRDVIFTDWVMNHLCTNSFSLSVEVFDLQSSLLHLYHAMMGSLDISQSQSAEQIQCRLVPLIPAIQDSASLYDLIFKLMKALHAGRFTNGEGLGEWVRDEHVKCKRKIKRNGWRVI